MIPTISQRMTGQFLPMIHFCLLGLRTVMLVKNETSCLCGHAFLFQRNIWHLEILLPSCMIIKKACVVMGLNNPGWEARDGQCSSWNVLGELQCAHSVKVRPMAVTLSKLNHQTAVGESHTSKTWCCSEKWLAYELEERLNQSFPFHQPSSKVTEK